MANLQKTSVTPNISKFIAEIKVLLDTNKNPFGRYFSSRDITAICKTYKHILTGLKLYGQTCKGLIFELSETSGSMTGSAFEPRPYSAPWVEKTTQYDAGIKISHASGAGFFGVDMEDIEILRIYIQNIASYYGAEMIDPKFTSEHIPLQEKNPAHENPAIEKGKVIAFESAISEMPVKQTACGLYLEAPGSFRMQLSGMAINGLNAPEAEQGSGFNNNPAYQSFGRKFERLGLDIGIVPVDNDPAAYFERLNDYLFAKNTTPSGEKKFADRKTSTAIVKRHIKKTWPQVQKISVKTDVYAGGSRMDVTYSAPTIIPEIDAFVKSFQAGHFNSMEDIYEYSDNREIILEGHILRTYKYCFTGFEPISE